MSTQELDELLEKYSQSACTQEEINRLEAWYLEIGKQQIGRYPKQQELKALYQRIQRKISKNQESVNRSFILRFPRWVQAAAILIIIGFTGFLYQQYLVRKVPFTIEESSATVLPAQVKAVLHTESGRDYLLGENQKDQIKLSAHNCQITYSDTGITYQHLQESNTPVSEHTAWHSIQTPNAGQYTVTLPDGSIAWLNANSSLSFPTDFDPHIRLVRMTGEVFFSIKKQKDNERLGLVPFVVETGKQKIEVLGTQFNVNAYPNESAQYVSLQEGRVKVTHLKSNKQVLLFPGETVKVNQSITLENQRTPTLLAWRKGDFVFQEEPLESILKQIARWYDVQITCPESLKEIPFSGMVSRKQPLSAIIEMLNSTQKIHVVYQERRLIVTK